jgi:hypothetical protein
MLWRRLLAVPLHLRPTRWTQRLIQQAVFVCTDQCRQPLSQGAQFVGIETAFKHRLLHA